MKYLTLYIDKWYIIGAVSIDGALTTINLPNGEDLIWLYFFEDRDNNKILYGRNYMTHYQNNEIYYLGDVFSLITDFRNYFTRYGHNEGILEIFSASGIIDDLKRPFEQEGQVDTYISFSSDISDASKLLFLNILNEKGFHVLQSVARIDHLALEYAYKKGQYAVGGYYLVLNACNENLHYSIYHLSDGLFVRFAENKLVGMGCDMRGRALVETVVEKANKRQHFLQTESEKEREYLRMTQLYLDEWMFRLSNAKSNTPFQLTDISFSLAPNNKVSVALQAKLINERTRVIVNDIVSEITSFVRKDVSTEEIVGIMMIGDTFTNSQFEKTLLSEISLSSDQIIRFQTKELPNLISVYSDMDGSQFSSDTQEFVQNATAEKKRKENAIREEEARKSAEEELKRKNEEERQLHEADKEYKNAMDKVAEFEKKEDYAQMLEWCDIALKKHPNDESALSSKDNAQRLLSEKKVKSEQYNESIKRAKASLKDGRMQDALSQAEMALNFRPDSKEALRIRDDARDKLDNAAKVKDFLTRADVFIAQKCYSQAENELNKASALSANDSEIQQRMEFVQKVQSEQKEMIAKFESEMRLAESAKDYATAATICEKMIEIDVSNTRKWSEKVQRLKNQAEVYEKVCKQLGELKKEINAAMFNDDWNAVIEKSDQYLAIESDEHIEKCREKAQRKITECKHKNDGMTTEQRKHQKPPNPDFDFDFVNSREKTTQSAPHQKNPPTQSVPQSDGGFFDIEVKKEVRNKKQKKITNDDFNF